MTAIGAPKGSSIGQIVVKIIIETLNNCRELVVEGYDV